MKKNPKIAVLMATYNGEKWLEPQLKSILKQKNAQINLIIQDDNSDDSTHKIIKKFKKKNKINFLINKKNQRSASLNFLKLMLQIDKNYLLHYCLLAILSIQLFSLLLIDYDHN